MIQEPGNPAGEAKCFLVFVLSSVHSWPFATSDGQSCSAALRVLPSCPNSPEDGAVRGFLLVVYQCSWLVSISSHFLFRTIEPWEGPICHLVPISRKMEIVGQVLAFLFSIIKGAGRVVTSCHSIEGCSSLDSVVLPSDLQSLVFDNVLSQTVPPLGMYSLTFTTASTRDWTI